MVEGQAKIASIKKTIESLPVDEKVLNTLESITWLVAHTLPISHTHSLVAFLDSKGVKTSEDHLSMKASKEMLRSGCPVLRRMVLEQFVPNALQKRLFPNGAPFGATMDRSQDRGHNEKETVILRVLGPDGLPLEIYFELAELDFADSEDGESPDAQCITACLEKVLKTLEVPEADGKPVRPPIIHKNKWDEALLGTSFDGADVMMGCNGGVAHKISDKCPQQVSIHAAAHVVQLCTKDGLDVSEYHQEFRAIINALCSEYSMSGKKRAQLHALAKEIDNSQVFNLAAWCNMAGPCNMATPCNMAASCNMADLCDMADLCNSQIFNLGSIHGIRWVASIYRVLLKLWRMLHVVYLDLQTRGKGEFKSKQKTIKTAPEMFLRSQIIEDGKKYRVDSIVEASTPVMVRFKCKALRGDGAAELSKAELVDLLDAGSDIDTWKQCCEGKTKDKTCAKCKGARMWELSLKISARRFILHLAFMLDMHDKLAAVSCCFQSRIIMVGSLANKVDDAIDELSILGDKAGALERKFNAYLEGAGGLWKADVLQIKGADDDSDVPAHLSDRKAICKALAGSFRVRYTSALSDPRVIAMKVFEHRLWPSAETNDGDDLQRFGIDQISRLLDNYSTFFDGVDNQQCMLQWNRPKRITMKDPVLRSLPLEELWPRILLKWVS